MSILTRFQSGVKSLSDLYAQAAVGIVKLNQEAQKSYASTLRSQLVKKLDRNLRDLSENGRFYSLVKAHFTYRGSVEDENSDVYIHISFSKPHEDDSKVFTLYDYNMPHDAPKTSMPRSKFFSLDYSSWKNLARDMRAFAETYEDAYAQAYSINKVEMEKRTRRVNALLLPYITRAENAVAAENLSHERKPD